jgi:hypothetical protein
MASSHSHLTDFIRVVGLGRRGTEVKPWLSKAFVCKQWGTSCHNSDCVVEDLGAALAVREAAVVQHLRCPKLLQRKFQ